MTSVLLPRRVISGPATTWLESSPIIEQSSASPRAPSPMSTRSWIAGRREKIDANSTPFRAKIAVTATRARCGGLITRPYPRGSAALHRLGRLDPEQVERLRQHPLGHHADREAHVLVAALLGGPDHAAVAVERGEVLRRLGRVGGEPVRRAPLSRLAHLAGQLEQLLDERPRRQVEALGARAQISRQRGL